MPDVNIAETSGAALAAGAEKPIDRGIVSSMSREQKKKQEFVNELKRERETTTDPMERFNNIAKRTEFGKGKRESVNAAFGGGEASIDPTTGIAELSSTASSENKANFEKAQRLNERYGKVLDYTQVLKEAARTHQDVKDVYKSEKFKLTETAWKKMRTDALNTLLNDGKITTNFADELKGLSDDQKRDYIDEVLAKDPALNEAIIARMEDIRTEAEKLEPVS